MGEPQQKLSGGEDVGTKLCDILEAKEPSPYSLRDSSSLYPTPVRHSLNG